MLRVPLRGGERAPAIPEEDRGGGVGEPLWTFAGETHDCQGLEFGGHLRGARCLRRVSAGQGLSSLLSARTERRDERHQRRLTDLGPTPDLAKLGHRGA